MPEMWARCDPCQRWFYVPFDSGERMSRSLCPVCATTAVAFQVRVADSSFPVELQDGVQLA